MNVMKRYPELGQVVYRDPGRFPVKLLLVGGPTLVVVAAVMYWLNTIMDPQEWSSPIMIGVCACVVILVGIILFGRYWRVLLVCEHGIVGYSRCFGSYLPDFILIDFPQLIAGSVQAVSDVRKISGEHAQFPHPLGKDTSYEKPTGPGVAFLARNRETVTAMCGGHLTSREWERAFPGSAFSDPLPLDDPAVAVVSREWERLFPGTPMVGATDQPSFGIVCWVHSSRDPAKLAYSLLSAMARDGSPAAATRLTAPMDYHDPVWNQFHR